MSNTILLVPDCYALNADVRFYHNYAHAYSVAETVKELVDHYHLGNLDDMWCAAIWHDAIYVPGATDNEERSANAMLAMHPYRTETARLIRSTTVADHLSEAVTEENDLNLSILLDADLKSLSSNYVDFVVAQRNIALEHKSTDLSMSAAFLKQFLGKKQIYRTEYMCSRFEVVARQNITRFISEYS